MHSTTLSVSYQSIFTDNSPTRLYQKGGWLGLKGLWPQMTITDPSARNSVFFPIHFWSGLRWQM